MSERKERGRGGGYWTLCLLVHLKGTFWSKGKKHTRPTEQAVHVVFFTAAGCNNSRRTAWVFIYTFVSFFVVRPQG